MNISLVSLHLFSLYSVSPLYTINSKNHKMISLISNSHFTHSFSHILYSNSHFHSTALQNNHFMHMINTPVVFSRFIDGYCKVGAECCVSTDYNFIKDQIIENAMVSNLSFPNEFDFKNCFFYENCGDIKMTKCQFSYCYTTQDNGGGIFIQEDCTVILHNCIFDHCHSGKNGGAAAIAKMIKFNDKPDISGVVTDDPMHDKTQRLDIQYTCFSDCYTDNKPKEGYGAVMMMGAKSVTFYYASTVNCANHGNKPKGAQFDILSTSISSQFINVTGGKTIYCGSLEYREASSGFFQYQTITNLECKYATSFTSVDIKGLAIRSCNIYKNTLLRPDGEDDKSNPPSLIFVRKLNLLVQNFYFKENNMNGYGKFASKENNDKLEITLDYCFADSNDQNYWNLDYVKTQNCVFENKPITTFGIRQLNLGHCQGEVKPGQMIITSLFTASFVFSKSDHFTSSEKFTESRTFTPSHHFNATNFFTPSDSFTPSGSFTLSSKFSKSNEFSNSDHFTKSAVFSESFEFTSSNSLHPLYGGKESNKGNKGVIIGATIGAVAGAAVIAGIIAFFIIRHRKGLAEAAIDMAGETDASVTVDNELQNVMDKDDPFANDF